MAKWESIAFALMMMYRVGSCLRCFECDNLENPACGVHFKSYQYVANTCLGGQAKCGLQRQQKIGDFIGIIRRCHILGSVPELNETDGCHQFIVGPYNHTFEICLCSTDYCNGTPLTTINIIVLVLSATLVNCVWRTGYST